MAAAIYVRKSTESDDRQVLSLPAQLAWARERARALGIASPLVIEEAMSAKKPGRPGFNRLMELVEKGEIDTVICWKADRLARNALDGGRVVYSLETKRMVRIVTADRTYLGEPDEEFVLGLELGLSAKFSKDLSKNVKRGLQEKLRRGEWIGRAPFGYRSLREDGKPPRLVLDDAIAPKLRALFRLAVTGSHSLAGLQDIALNELGLTAPNRRREAAARRLPTSTLARLLKSPFYYGAMIVKGQTYAGSHPPLISREMSERVSAVLSGRQTKAERPKTRTFALTGLVRCGKCGRRLTAYTQTKASGKVFCYYTCTNRQKGRCTLAPLSEREAFVPVRQALTTLSFTRSEVDFSLGMIAEIAARRAGDLSHVREGLASEIAAVRVAQGQLLDLLIAGTVTREDYERKRAELAGREAELTLQLNAAEADQGEKLEQLRVYFRALEDALAAFDDAEPIGKKAILRQIGLELEAGDDGLRLVAEKPAALLLARADRSVGSGLVEDVLTAMENPEATAR